jgi:hypothetical protein
MSINSNAPVLLITAVFVWAGGYLILRPQEYKGELWRSGDNVISRFPRWAVRILGVFLIVMALGVSYLALKSSK